MQVQTIQHSYGTCIINVFAIDWFQKTCIFNITWGTVSKEKTTLQHSYESSHY